MAVLKYVRFNHWSSWLVFQEWKGASILPFVSGSKMTYDSIHMFKGCNGCYPIDCSILVVSD